MKNLIIFLVVIAVLVGAYFLITTKSDPESAVTWGETYTFTSEEGDITVRFDELGDKAELTLGGVKHELERAISASGARYLSADESVEYWEHQGTATVRIDDEVVFEGAAAVDDEPELRDPSEDTRESLEGTSWQWKETLYNNDEVVTPVRPEEFILTFMEDGRFSAETDCNTRMGSYAVTESSLEFGEAMASTKMACEESQEEEFAAMLVETVNYLVTGEGELALMLKFDSGSMMFTPVSE